MWKFSYLLLGAVLLGGLLPAEAEARNDGKYTYEAKGHKHHHSEPRWKGDHKKHNERGNEKHWGHKKANHPLRKSHLNHGKKVYYATPNPKRVKNVYYAKPVPRHAPRVHYVKPRVTHYYSNPYRPKYVYVKPHHKPRYYGHYLYRGFYWPFVNVRFVVNLSTLQLEKHHQAVYLALDAPVGETVRWRDGVQRGSIEILREGFDNRGSLCKQYRQILYYRTHSTSNIMTSCLSPDGYWISV
tara:strand:- start:212 stop:934 length:723 start_codon:yes stop_codon:yes gene_type:complete